MNNKNIDHDNPVLVELYGITYKYRLIRDLRISRKVEDRRNIVPESHAKAVILLFIKKILSKENKHLQLNYPRTFIKVFNESKNYCIGIIIQIANGLIHIADIRKIEVDSCESETLDSAEGNTLLLKNVDLNPAIIEVETSIKKHQIFYNSEDVRYRIAFTKHVSEKRTGRKNARLTLPVPVIRNILKFFVKNSLDKIEKYMEDSINEKKVVIVFQDKDKAYNIGILVVINIAVPGNMVFLVLTMIDEKPRSNYAVRILFPKVPRLQIDDFNLKEEIEKYKLALPPVAKPEDIKKIKTTITKVSSMEEYYKSHAIKKGKIGHSIKKIQIIEKENKKESV